jgi:hypothetical protein
MKSLGYDNDSFIFGPQGIIEVFFVLFKKQRYLGAEPEPCVSKKLDFDRFKAIFRTL